jgi:hypothetical protein
MPTIAYQSFNANASTTHGLASIANQRFTRDTNAHVTGQGHQALVLPHNAGDLATPIHGPAHLRPIERLEGQHSAPVFGTQVSLAFQNFYRALGAMPDIMVLGELDTSHPDFASMMGGTGMSVAAHASRKACQSFTVVSQTDIASGVKFLDAGEGYVVYTVGGMIVVFVHVPNRIATSAVETKQFYLNIAQAVCTGGRQIDVVIGDTNQPGFNFSEQVLNNAFGTNAYRNASSQAGAAKFDNWNVEEKGTNSTGTKMYDVAIYRSDLNEVTGGPIYLSQSSGAVTVTDHCGVALTIKRKGAG